MGKSGRELRGEAAASFAGGKKKKKSFSRKDRFWQGELRKSAVRPGVRNNPPKILSGTTGTRIHRGRRGVNALHHPNRAYLNKYAVLKRVRDPKCAHQLQQRAPFGARLESMFPHTYISASAFSCPLLGLSQVGSLGRGPRGGRIECKCKSAPMRRREASGAPPRVCQAVYPIAARDAAGGYPAARDGLLGARYGTLVGHPRVSSQKCAQHAHASTQCPPEAASVFDRYSRALVRERG
jgi:hypothetical protein